MKYLRNLVRVHRLPTDLGDRVVKIDFRLSNRLVGHLLVNRRHKIQ